MELAEKRSAVAVRCALTRLVLIVFMLIRRCRLQRTRLKTLLADCLERSNARLGTDFHISVVP